MPVGPYDREHGLLVWGGTLPGGESWSCSLHMAETEQTIGTNDAAGWNMDELIDHYVPIVKNFHMHGSVGISSLALLEFVKFNRRDINGRYIDPVTFMRTFTPVAGGASSSLKAPNQTTLAVTLRTEVTRGPASAGRFYLPKFVVAPETDGLLSTTNADLVRDQAKIFVEALSDVPGIDTAMSPGVCVMSRKAGAPATRRVNGIWVGRVIDTQRRRRRQLKENYRSVAVDQGDF